MHPDKEIDRLCEFLSMDWDAKRQAFVDAEGHIISLKLARRLAQPAKADRLEESVDELSMLVRMLVQHVPEDKQIKARAVDYLARHGLAGSPLRASEALSGGEAVGDYQLRPKTAALVRRFMSALASKLAAAEVKYGYSDAWIDPAWEDECRRQLHHHAAKGDPRDVAAYAAFCWHHGWSTTLPGSFSPITENDPSREESRTPRQSASSRVSHGLHMKVKGGKIVYRRKSRVVE